MELSLQPAERVLNIFYSAGQKARQLVDVKQKTVGDEVVVPEITEWASYIEFARTKTSSPLFGKDHRAKNDVTL